MARLLSQRLIIGGNGEFGGIFGQIVDVFGHSSQLNIGAIARASQAVSGEMFLGRLTVHFSMTNWQSLRDMEHFALLHGLDLVSVKLVVI